MNMKDMDGKPATCPDCGTESVYKYIEWSSKEIHPAKMYDKALYIKCSKCCGTFDGLHLVKGIFNDHRINQGKVNEKPFYNEGGDMLEVYWKNCEARAEYINPYVSIFKCIETGELCGVVIRGITEALAPNDIDEIKKRLQNWPQWKKNSIGLIIEED